MARSKSSKNWLREHFADPYVQASQKHGYRSRAVYKLLALQEKDKIISPGMTVIDLGAAPGGWSQLATEFIGPSGRIYALDILPMEPLPGVEFIQGDFTKQEVLDALLEALNHKKVDVVLSDIAPNISGIKMVDQPRAMYLAELVLDAAKKTLNKNGSLVIKVFQGEGFDVFLRTTMAAFSKVAVRKPPASRSRSSEFYLICKGFKG